MDFEIPEDLKQIQMLVRRFVKDELLPLEEMVEERHDFPEEIRKPLIKRAWELGIRQMGIEPEYGGAGIGALGQVLASEEMGGVSEALSYGILAGEQDVLDVATQEQRKKYLVMFPFKHVKAAKREGCLSPTPDILVPENPYPCDR